MTGKVLGWIYAIGYAAHVLLAAVWSWPKLGLLDWWTYMAFQVAFYGPTWPFWLLRGLVFG